MKHSIPGFKDENGIYAPLPKPRTEPDSAPNPDVSLDDIGRRVIIAMDRASKILLETISAGNVDRDTIGALKDVSMMLKDLKKEEKDYLESLTDEQLNSLTKNTS